MEGCNWQHQALQYQPVTWYQKYGKTIMDKLAAIIILLILLPVLIIIGIFIKLDSKGTILYRQQRVGKNGELFILYKFRTMVVNAEQLQEQLLEKNEADGPFFKLKNDPRITRIGHFLRSYSLDELPQLFNVIRGDMSLVGPRPTLYQEMLEFAPWMCERFAVKPGITGLWQITTRKNDLSVKAWIRLDIRYIQKISFNYDSWILWRTLKVILVHENE